jgi:hypothetical protein
MDTIAQLWVVSGKLKDVEWCLKWNILHSRVNWEFMALRGEKGVYSRAYVWGTVGRMCFCLHSSSLCY